MNLKQSEGEVIARLCEMAAEQANLDVSAVTPESDFINDLNFDSLDVVEYVMKIEEEFDVSIDDERVEGVRTPRQAHQMLKAVVANQTAG
jgi:acyl carrier protein